MIVKTTFRQSRGLEAHLLRNDTNERVEIRKDFFRGPSLDLNLALRLMDGIARSNPRTKRSFVHVVIAPEHPLNDSALEESLNAIELEFGISPDAPRALVEHAKGTRAAHFHAAYSIVDIKTGLAIKSHNSYAKDELVSRRLELKFREKVTPGPRLQENIAELRAREATNEADQLALHASGPGKDPLSRPERQQAERLGSDVATMSALVFDLFEKSGRDLEIFARELPSHGYHLCEGEKAILVGSDEDGVQISLVRCLRREGKASGSPVILREWHLKQAFLDLKAPSTERDAGLERAHDHAIEEVASEWQRGLFEALADADEEALTKFRAERKRQREEQQQADRNRFGASLKARRAAIIALHKQRDEVRRRRVDRAFHSARLFDAPAMKRLAFALATMGILMTGAGLTAALIGGGLAPFAIPSFRRARRLASVAKQEREQDRRDRNLELDEAYERTRREGFTRLRAARRFSFDQVARGDRVLAGLYVASLIKTGKSSDPAIMEQIKAALGPEVVAGLMTIMERGSPLQVKRLLQWYRAVPEHKQSQAITAALHRGRAPDHDPKRAANQVFEPSGNAQNQVRRMQASKVESKQRKVRQSTLHRRSSDVER